MKFSIITPVLHMVICGNIEQITGSVTQTFDYCYSYFNFLIMLIFWGGRGSSVRSVLAFHQFEPGLNVSNPGGDAIYVWVWKSVTMLNTVNIAFNQNASRFRSPYGASLWTKEDKRSTPKLFVNSVNTSVSSNHGRLEEFQPTLFWASNTSYFHNVNLVSTCR